MKMMLDAKKHNKPSFVYKGKKYKQGKTKTGLVIYKKGQVFSGFFKLFISSSIRLVVFILLSTKFLDKFT